jgi:hypothetical protein
LVRALDFDGAASRADILVLPDRLVEEDGERVAAFRPEAQPMRVDINAAGRTVELLVPAGARRRSTEEHAAEWILPVVLLVGQIPVGVASTLIADWIRNRRVERPEARRMLYREAARLPDGTFRVIQIEGPPEEVATVVERRQGGLPPGD